MHNCWICKCVILGYVKELRAITGPLLVNHVRSARLIPVKREYHVDVHENKLPDPPERQPIISLVVLHPHFNRKVHELFAKLIHAVDLGIGAVILQTSRQSRMHISDIVIYTEAIERTLATKSRAGLLPSTAYRVQLDPLL